MYVLNPDTSIRKKRNGLIIKNLKQFIPQFYLKQMDPISNSRYSSRSQFLFYLSFMRNRATLITLLEETFQQISQFGKPTSANNLAFFDFFSVFVISLFGNGCKLQLHDHLVKYFCSLPVSNEIHISAKYQRLAEFPITPGLDVKKG